MNLRKIHSVKSNVEKLCTCIENEVDLQTTGVGRGVIATPPFSKNKGVFDHHGLSEDNQAVESEDQEIRNPEYVIEVKGKAFLA